MIFALSGRSGTRVFVAEGDLFCALRVWKAPKWWPTHEDDEEKCVRWKHGTL